MPRKSFCCYPAPEVAAVKQKQRLESPGWETEAAQLILMPLKPWGTSWEAGGMFKGPEAHSLFPIPFFHTVSNIKPEARI